MNSVDPSGGCPFCILAVAFVAGGGISVLITEGASFAQNGQWASGRQVAAAFAAGGVAGVISLFGGEAIGGALIASAAGGAAGQCVANMIDPAHSGNIATAALWGAAGGAFGTHFDEPLVEARTGANRDPWWYWQTRNWSQFNPRSYRRFGAVKRLAFRNRWRAYSTSAAVGTGSAIGWPGPARPQ